LDDPEIIQLELYMDSFIVKMDHVKVDP